MAAPSSVAQASTGGKASITAPIETTIVSKPLSSRLTRGRRCTPLTGATRDSAVSPGTRQSPVTRLDGPPPSAEAKARGGRRTRRAWPPEAGATANPTFAKPSVWILCRRRRFTRQLAQRGSAGAGRRQGRSAQHCNRLGRGAGVARDRGSGAAAGGRGDHPLAVSPRRRGRCETARKQTADTRSPGGVPTPTMPQAKNRDVTPRVNLPSAPRTRW